MDIDKSYEDKILKRFSNVINFLNERPNVLFGYIFGSVATGRETKISDVDIAVYFDNCDDLVGSKLNLYSKLIDLLKTDKLDLVILNEAPLNLKAQVIKNKIVIVDKQPFTRQRYESLVLREYFDFSIKEKDVFARRYSIGR